MRGMFFVAEPIEEGAVAFGTGRGVGSDARLQAFCFHPLALGFEDDAAPYYRSWDRSCRPA